MQGCARMSAILYVLVKRVPELGVGLAGHFLKEWNASPFSETLKLGIYWPWWGLGGRRERNTEGKRWWN